MCNHEHGAFCIVQVILQPENCCDVEVVCRLIQKKELCVFYKYLGEGNLFAHSAGKCAHAAGHIGNAEGTQN